MILRGVLARSFENILCLRGFAPLGDLAKLSFPDESYQRKEIMDHRDDLVGFLESGEYTFFPEVVLGGSLGGMGFSDEDVTALYKAVDSGEAFTLRNVGDISVSSFVKRFKRGGEYDLQTTASFYKLKDSSFSRIDGNHRLQAVGLSTEKVQKYSAPFCLVLFRNDEERRRFGRVFFHMINFRAEPISEEHNLRLILDEDDFSDERLKEPPFGREFFLTRLCLRNETVRKSKLKDMSHTVFVKLVRYLLMTEEFKTQRESIHDGNGNSTDENGEWFCQKFSERVGKLDKLLGSNSELDEICMSDKNILASLVVILFRMKDISEFVAWLIARSRDGELKLSDIPFEKIVNAFDAGQLERSRTIFVSMQFGSCGTEQNYATIKQTVDIVNADFKLHPKLRVVRVDKVVTGKTFEINEKILNQVAQCGYLIADLTYCNSNVYHEIGMLMGRTLALTGKHEYNMTLILDKQVSQENKIVKFNLTSLQRLEFSKQEELAKGIRERLIAFYKL